MAVAARTGFQPDLAHPSLLWMLFQAEIYEPARLLITLGHMSLIVSLFRVGALGQATLLRAFGRMALSVYMMQAVLTSVLFYGLGYLDHFSFVELTGTCVGIWGVTGLFCLTWLRKFDIGPVEGVLRAIAYGSFRDGWRKREAVSAEADTASI